ncbi:EVE domain-containing protein [Stakelama flava]
MKSEPDEYGWDDLVRDGRTEWTGVRNHAAAKNLRAMTCGDRAFFYHSACAVPAIAGIMEVSREWRADGEDGKWASVEVNPVAPLPRAVPLKKLKEEAALRDMATLKQGRLSVSPVSEAEWTHICALAAMGDAKEQT